MLDVIDGGSRQKHQARRKAEQRRAWAASATAQSQANAAALRSDPQVISQLQEMIAARIGRPVRHVRSETVLKFGDKGGRTHTDRRGYTKHWFEVSGVVDDKLAPLLDGDRLLVVFLKSAVKLTVSPPLEYILSEQGGKGFRTPYFFGLCTVSDLKIGAWEAIETNVVPFKRYSVEDQRRIVEAVAAVNAVRAGRTVPARIRWVSTKPRWFEWQYRAMDTTAQIHWKELYTRTMDVMRHQYGLVRRLRCADQVFLTHNDVHGSNVLVPQTGDVIVYDWESSTLSVPGADLGFVSRLDSGAHLLSCYVSKMAQHGFKLDADRVRFTLDVVQGFRSLHRGWGKHKTNEAEVGLTLLARHLN